MDDAGPMLATLNDGQNDDNHTSRRQLVSPQLDAAPDSRLQLTSSEQAAAKTKTKAYRELPNFPACCITRTNSTKSHSSASDPNPLEGAVEVQREGVNLGNNVNCPYLIPVTTETSFVVDSIVNETNPLHDDVNVTRTINSSGVVANEVVTIANTISCQLRLDILGNMVNGLETDLGDSQIAFIDEFD